MYLLDTNILSELMRINPNQDVIHWLDNQFVDDLAISSITIAEIRLGIALLPEGKRKQALSQAANHMFTDFAKNLRSFEADAAAYYAEIVAKRTKIGRPISVEDAQIAAIARVANAVLVTRNVVDFEKIEGLEVYNPFFLSD